MTNGDKLKILNKKWEIESMVRKAVAEYLDENAADTNLPFHIILDEEAKSHVINIGTTIMLNRLGVNTNPGGFIQAVLDNDLQGAFLKPIHIPRRSGVNSQVLGFYMKMISNLEIDITGQKVKEAS